MGCLLRILAAAVVLATVARAVNVGGVTRNTCFYDFVHSYHRWYHDDECCTETVCWPIDDDDDRGFLVPFMGNHFDVTFWENNGILYLYDETNQVCGDTMYCETFPQTTTTAIFPYLIDLYDYDMGMNFAGIQNDKDELAPIVADLQSAGLASAYFDPDWAFIATVIFTTPKGGCMERLAPADAAVDAAGDANFAECGAEATGTSEYVNYQFVLISDGDASYVVFKYGELRVPGGDVGAGGTVNDPCFYARIGFNDRDNYMLYKPGEVSSNSADTIEGNSLRMMTETNCGVQGMLVFDVTSSEIVQPAEGATCAGVCSGYHPLGLCPRCRNVDRENGVFCERFGYCFPEGSVVADMECTAACRCLSSGKWDGCKPLKKDGEERKEACLSCREGNDDGVPCMDPDAIGGITNVFFVDSAWCGMRDCLVSTNKKVCPDGSTICFGDDLPAKLILHKKAQTKLGFANHCDICDPEEEL